MNKVLVTGLGLGKEFGVCEICGLDFSWLVSNPSTLLWADQICIPKGAFDELSGRNETKQQKVISLFLEKADEKGIIEKIDPSEIYQSHIGDTIYEHMKKDSVSLMQAFPGIIEKGDERVPDEIIIENEGYCGAWMASVQLGIKLANDIGANCLFGKREHTYLKYIYGLEAAKIGGANITKVYDEIFSLYLPESIGIHNYAFEQEERCEECAKYDLCKTNFLTDTELAIEKILKWREYDELQQAKEELDKIIRIKNSINTDKDIKEIAREFKERQDTINKNINKRFPIIKRWTKMTTVVATPFTIASAATGNMPLAIGGAVASGISTIADNLMDVYESKNNWVGFVNQMKNS